MRKTSKGQGRARPVVRRLDTETVHEANARR